MKVYCIYDKIAEESGPLFEAKNDVLAYRIFMGLNLPEGYKRSDFELYLMGYYCHEPPVHIIGKTKASIVRIANGNIEDEEVEVETV